MDGDHYSAAMTSLDVPKSQLPLDAADPYTRHVNWRRIVRVVLALIVVLVVATPIVWWEAAARTDALQPGGESAIGTAAVLQAGYTTEYCYTDVPGSTIVFGFSIMNTGSHAVTVTSIDFPLPDMTSPSFTFGPVSRGGAVSPQEATQTLPVTFQPGQDRQVFLTMHLSTTITIDTAGQDLVDGVTLHVRALGISRTQDFTFGDSLNQLWLGISGFDEQGQACDFNRPANTNQ